MYDVGQSQELRRLLCWGEGKDVGCERMPALLDWLLRQDFAKTDRKTPKGLQKHEAEVLMLGLNPADLAPAWLRVA